MLNLSWIRRRFGTTLPSAALGMVTVVVVGLCLCLLAGLERSDVNGITYSIHFAGTPNLIAFAAAIGLIIACHRWISQWLMRRDDIDVKREKRFFTRVSEYNEARSTEQTSDS